MPHVLHHHLTSFLNDAEKWSCQGVHASCERRLKTAGLVSGALPCRAKDKAKTHCSARMYDLPDHLTNPLAEQAQKWDFSLRALKPNVQKPDIPPQQTVWGFAVHGKSGTWNVENGTPGVKNYIYQILQNDRKGGPDYYLCDSKDNPSSCALLGGNIRRCAEMYQEDTCGHCEDLGLAIRCPVLGWNYSKRAWRKVPIYPRDLLGEMYRGEWRDAYQNPMIASVTIPKGAWKGTDSKTMPDYLVKENQVAGTVAAVAGHLKKALLGQPTFPGVVDRALKLAVKLTLMHTLQQSLLTGFGLNADKAFDHLSEKLYSETLHVPLAFEVKRKCKKEVHEVLAPTLAQSLGLKGDWLQKDYTDFDEAWMQRKTGAKFDLSNTTEKNNKLLKEGWLARAKGNWKHNQTWMCYPRLNGQDKTAFGSFVLEPTLHGDFVRKLQQHKFARALMDATPYTDQKKYKKALEFKERSNKDLLKTLSSLRCGPRVDEPVMYTSEDAVIGCHLGQWFMLPRKSLAHIDIHDKNTLHKLTQRIALHARNDGGNAQVMTSTGDDKKVDDIARKLTHDVVARAEGNTYVTSTKWRMAQSNEVLPMFSLTSLKKTPAPACSSATSLPECTQRSGCSWIHEMDDEAKMQKCALLASDGCDARSSETPGCFWDTKSGKCTYKGECRPCGDFFGGECGAVTLPRLPVRQDYSPSLMKYHGEFLPSLL